MIIRYEIFILILYGRRTNPTVYFDSGYSLCVAVATLGETAESRGIGRSWLERAAANGPNSLKPHPEKYKDIMRNGAEIDTRQGIKIIKISLKSVKVSKATQQ